LREVSSTWRSWSREREIFQKNVDFIYERFTKVVREGRKIEAGRFRYGHRASGIDKESRRGTAGTGTPLRQKEGGAVSLPVPDRDRVRE
jgi:hypothetical protein